MTLNDINRQFDIFFRWVARLDSWGILALVSVVLCVSFLVDQYEMLTYNTAIEQRVEHCDYVGELPASPASSDPREVYDCQGELVEVFLLPKRERLD